MYYIIGMAINMGNASALGIGEIIILICYGMIIVGVLVRMFYRYRYKLM